MLWHSHAGDEPRDVWQHLGLDYGQGGPIRETDAQRRKRLVEERAEAARQMAFCREIWADTVGAEGTPVEAYLRGRAITGPIPKALRFHPAAPLAYPTQERPEPRTFPAMVAVVTGADGKTASGLHVTALAPGGRGKAMDRARRMFGDLAGGVVQLAPLPKGGELAVAEGIETSLSFRDITGTPSWAALSTSGLRTFTPPVGLARLVIAADADDGGAGIEAARELARRGSRRCECVVMPAPEGMDWNDVARRGQQ